MSSERRAECGSSLNILSPDPSLVQCLEPNEQIDERLKEAYSVCLALFLALGCRNLRLAGSLLHGVHVLLDHASKQEKEGTIGPGAVCPEHQTTVCNRCQLELPDLITSTKLLCPSQFPQVSGLGMAFFSFPEQKN